MLTRFFPGLRRPSSAITQPSPSLSEEDSLLLLLSLVPGASWPALPPLAIDCLWISAASSGVIALVPGCAAAPSPALLGPGAATATLSIRM